MTPIRPTNWLKIMRKCINNDRHELCTRWYDAKNMSKKKDWNKLRPMIKKRIENRADFYPINAMVPLAQHVLLARSRVIHGVDTLLRALPVLTCKFCPEVYVGETGHLIHGCWGYKRLTKNQLHHWIKASLNDILVPVETFRLDSRVQDVIKHHQRFDCERVPAVVELCRQAGAHLEDSDLQSEDVTSNSVADRAFEAADSLSADDLSVIGSRTIAAWEALREGVEKLLLVYPVKVCKHCSEVHVGHSGHKARLCGVFKYQSWKGSHFWEKASVDDVVPPKIVWYRRPQDPPALLNEGRNYYGHAPAVVDLCCKAGAIPPAKYSCMMKVQGLTRPTPDKVSC
ncbi:hypothetical protein vseg_003564 [Gypsophila vaccaria]